MILSVENGSFSYGRQSKPVFENVGFSVGPSDILSILGPNGAGKTTLLRCVMGFLRWNNGKSCLDGTDIRSIPPQKLWRSVAYVPQAKNSAVPSYTVAQMILLGRGSRISMLSNPKSQDIEKVEEVMERLGISALRDKKCSELSGGELQMTLIARALVSQPQVLILDEPESSLDFKNQLLVLEAMSALAADGMSCVFNTHYPAHALQRANKALLLGAQNGPMFGDTHFIVTERNIELAFGVKAAIGEIETPENIMQDVVPLRLSNGLPEGDEPDGSGKNRERVLAAVAVIADGNELAQKINGILHDYGDFIIGRMGLPYPPRNVFIINVTLDAPPDTVRSLVSRLNFLPGVSVKATFQPQSRNKKELPKGSDKPK